MRTAGSVSGEPAIPTGPDMFTGRDDEQAFHYAAPGELRVGMYVHIDLPWFRHPFTLNSFRIASEGQVEELRALKVERFRYEPGRSLLATGAPPPAFTLEAAPSAPADEASDDDGAPAGEALDPRTQPLKEHCKAVRRAEKSFTKALGVVRRLDRDLVSRQPGPALAEMGALIERMVEAFLERPEVTLQVMGRNCGGDEAHHHSLNVSILCMMLARDLELDAPQATALGIGALVHDIGLTLVPDHIRRNTPGRQTRAERDLRERHVEYGVEIGRRLKLPTDVLTIIAQHHELADGSGYPGGLALDRIAPLARVISLVNSYENICNPVDFGQAMTPHEALSFIFARRKDRFEARVLQLLIRSLGVYPPGSVVRLSNEALAMVVSVNPHRPLRPWVLPYDASVPREEAAFLNLETHRDLNISEAIRPALLPAPVHAYLCPRRRITYFFDGGTHDRNEAP